MASPYIIGIAVGNLLVVLNCFLLWQGVFRITPPPILRKWMALMMFAIITGAILIGLAGGLFIAHELAR